jgi:hypothetical protein
MGGSKRNAFGVIIKAMMGNKQPSHQLEKDF